MTDNIYTLTSLAGTVQVIIGPPVEHLLDTAEVDRQRQERLRSLGYME